MPTFTPGLTSGIQTAWPRRLQPLLDVLEELGCEPQAVLSKQLFPDAPKGKLNLSAVVGRSPTDLKPFLNIYRPHYIAGRTTTTFGGKSAGPFVSLKFLKASWWFSNVPLARWCKPFTDAR